MRNSQKEKELYNGTNIIMKPHLFDSISSLLRALGLPEILPPVDGFVWYDRAKFHSGFCADLPEEEADFMFVSQVHATASAFTYVFKDVAWKMKPSWHIVATGDHSLPTELERFMGKRAGAKVSELKSSHVLFILHPKEAADVIEAATKGAAVK